MKLFVEVLLPPEFKIEVPFKMTSRLGFVLGLDLKIICIF